MSLPSKTPYISFQDYLAAEEVAEEKSEYSNGEVFAMAGGTEPHSLISSNINRQLGNALEDRDCRVYNSDLKVRIEKADAAAYPDAMVICGPVEFLAGRKDIVTNPIMIIEVLSPSTASWDFLGKFRLYEQLSSLQEYILIAQDAPQIDVFRRNDEGKWILSRYDGLEAVVHFQSIEVQIPSASIFQKVDFAAQG